MTHLGALFAFFFFFQQAAVNPIPPMYSELASMSSSEMVQTGLGNGTVGSLIALFDDQETRRELQAFSQPPMHQSLLPRPVLRQQTRPSDAGNGASPVAVQSAPAVKPPPLHAIATLVGKYRPPEITANVRLVAGIYLECTTRGPTCEKIELERDTGPLWELANVTVVAKTGYTLEGYDYSGPQCGAFRLQYAVLPKGKDGKSYVKFQLLRQPNWPQPEAADCKMTLYEAPIVANATPAN